MRQHPKAAIRLLQIDDRLLSWRTEYLNVFCLLSKSKKMEAQPGRVLVGCNTDSEYLVLLINIIG